MKTIVPLALLLTFLTACDSPQRTRFPLGTDSLSKETSPSGFVNPSTTPGTTTPVNLGPGFESCDLSPKYSAAGLGSFGLCQSTQDETVFMVKPSSVATGGMVCLIPTFKDPTGSSTYLSTQPQCFTATAGTSVQGKVYKNRSGFESYTLNGMMVISSNSLQPYYSCMNAFLSYVSQGCPYGYATSTVCAQYASQYRDQVCTAFKSQYSTTYVDIRLK